MINFVGYEKSVFFSDEFKFMRIKSVHIVKYKLFNNFDIDFCDSAGKPLDIVVLAGVNGSGKSTLLEYLSYHSGLAVKGAHSGNTVVEDEGRDKLFRIPPDLSQAAEYKKLFSQVVYYGALNDDNASKQLENVILKYVDRFVYVDGKTSFEAYSSIRSMMDDIFEGFRLQIRFKGIDADKHLIFQGMDDAEFGVEGLSDGEKQILLKVFPLFDMDMAQRVILMDEPESSLHPSWQSYLLPVLRRCVQRNGCQFILATHSPQIISSTRNEEIRVLSRDESGAVVAECCGDGPYGWTVARVLDEIQNVRIQRTPEVEAALEELHGMLTEGVYDTDGFKSRLGYLEDLLGYSDPDLSLIRMEIVRKMRGTGNEKDRER